MKRPSIWFYSGFLAGPVVLLCYGAFAKRFPSAHEIIIVCLLFGTIAALPRFLSHARKEAVPSKRSDWIGYAFIGLFCMLAYLVARAVIT